MPSRLPASPDFAAVEAAAPAFADRQNQILTLIGNLILSWSNNESVFVYIILILLETDEVAAAVVFSTLNTTRARLDLIRRLAIVKIKDPAVAQILTRLIRRFDACTKVRNEMNHCIYSLNERGEIVSTQLMRIEETRGRISLGDMRSMDDARVQEITETNRQLKRLNRDLWGFLPTLRSHIDEVGRGQTDDATPDPLRVRAERR